MTLSRLRLACHFHFFITSSTAMTICSYCFPARQFLGKAEGTLSLTCMIRLCEGCPLVGHEDHLRKKTRCSRFTSLLSHKTPRLWERGQYARGALFSAFCRKSSISSAGSGTVRGGDGGHGAGGGARGVGQKAGAAALRLAWMVWSQVERCSVFSKATNFPSSLKMGTSELSDGRRRRRRRVGVRVAA